MDTNTAAPADATASAVVPPAKVRVSSVPVVLQGGAIMGPAGIMTDTLDMRRPKVKDRLNVARMAQGKSQEEQEVMFIANLVSLAPGDIEGLDYDDYNRLQDALMSF
jgi:hypothetical protein